VRESDLFDERTNAIVEKYVKFLAPKARCILNRGCETICEPCQRDHDIRSRDQIRRSLSMAVRTIEIYAPHLLKRG